MRRKPEFSKENLLAFYQDSRSNSPGCIFVLPFIITGYFVILSIIHTGIGTATRIEQLTSFAALIGISILFIRGIISILQESAKKEAEKRKWIESCTVAQVKITERHGGIWDDGYRYHESWWLKLEVKPNQIVSVKVSQVVYNRLEKCSEVRIYYKTQDPLVFLLENEF